MIQSFKKGITRKKKSYNPKRNLARQKLYYTKRTKFKEWPERVVSNNRKVNYDALWLQREPHPNHSHNQHMRAKKKLPPIKLKKNITSSTLYKKRAAKGTAPNTRPAFARELWPRTTKKNKLNISNRKSRRSNWL